MSLTLGLTGMDPATETTLKSAFSEANADMAGAWSLVPEGDATYVVVDMDTLYGPMSWLRLHAADKKVIGLTTAARTQTDYRLERPISVQGLATILRDIAGASDQPATQPQPQPQAAVPEAAQIEAIAPSPLSPEYFTDLAASIPSAPWQAPAAGSGSEPERETETETEREQQPERQPESEPIPTSPPAAAAPPSPIATTLLEWLASGRLKGRGRIRSGNVTVLIDSDQQTYHGPTSLKPLTELFAQAMDPEGFEPVNEAAWDHDTASLGGAQPLSRLVWFGSLLSGNGTLATGYDPNDRFRLLKWPQTEREYPKHFRIATVMMKGPATLADITEASGVAWQEVNDFVNANLATGFAEPYREPDPEPDTGKSGGLFGRLRGR
ncbi:hypothetical protein [Aerolutibacter ruishenii]|uniref:Uncharacterized protein n=1 Tax=Aerolutibacter ruishenii TaxID=686800 RepID=A0A562LSU0_9GAMM|nr:hypothetical protein [Lysobacter ruishenii]TWI10679.1 hypothetical protein IP93_01770 [Lysobacter ruishenii]